MGEIGRLTFIRYFGFPKRIALYRTSDLISFIRYYLATRVNIW